MHDTYSIPATHVISLLPFQCFQDISSENQRLKDENGALIRVIGKLSRSPVQQH